MKLGHSENLTVSLLFYISFTALWEKVLVLISAQKTKALRVHEIWGGLLSKRKVFHFMVGKTFAQCVGWLRIPSGIRKKRDCSLTVSYGRKLLHNFVFGNINTLLVEML
jgi:hypothetical protein